MNKLVFTAVACMISVAAAAEIITVPVARTVNGKYVTGTDSVDAEEYFSQIAQRKGSSSRWDKVNSHRLALEGVQMQETIHRIDSILSNARYYVSMSDKMKICGKMVNVADVFPMCYANWPLSCRAAAASDLIRKAMSERDKQVAKEMSVIAARYDHMFKNGALEMQEIARLAVPAIKRKIRSEGSSFTVVGGVNPIQLRLDRLAAAMNAYRLEGLDEALRECGLDYGLSFESLLLPEQEIKQLEEKVLNGTVPFKEAKDKLRTHLGVASYNSLVDMYNGGE